MIVKQKFINGGDTTTGTRVVKVPLLIACHSVSYNEYDRDNDDLQVNG